MDEIEVTYLLIDLPPDLEKHRFEHIQQGYFSDGDDALRIRKKGDKHELTKKEVLVKGDFSAHNEMNIDIKAEEFVLLWPKTTKRLRKKRYYYNLGNSLKAEIDVFEDELKGLVFVEVEFPSKKAMSDFKPPDWFGKEVTQEDWSYNGFLAGKTFSNIKKYLQ